jgi:hypothetical protein
MNKREYHQQVDSDKSFRLKEKWTQNYITKMGSFSPKKKSLCLNIGGKAKIHEVQGFFLTVWFCVTRSIESFPLVFDFFNQRDVCILLEKEKKRGQIIVTKKGCREKKVWDILFRSQIYVCTHIFFGSIVFDHALPAFNPLFAD